MTDLATRTEVERLTGIRSKHTPSVFREWQGGYQLLFKFDNGYGASLLIGTIMAYGGLEMAVIVWDGDEYELTFDTPVTNDVLGHLVRDDLEPLLDQIAALPAQTKAIDASEKKALSA